MKRDPALQPLSRDHHRALVLARQAVRAAEDVMGAEPAEVVWAAVREAMARDLEPHFRVEEAVLLPALEAAGAAGAVARTRSDHAGLRRLAAEGGEREALGAFGRLLRDHVQFEEQTLFPEAERLLDAADLQRVAAAHGE